VCFRKLRLARNLYLFVPTRKFVHRRKYLIRNAGDDETRTRDLCRDSAAGIGFTTTYKTRGDCQTPRTSYKTYQTVGWFVGWEFLAKITPDATL
jgi:hypothetical protein